jgi:diaminohydroxyphosphoribosylaminopyrimidine deaminase/5-amino-6-(5-phosphoribosylamino)uracil reductase
MESKKRTGREGGRPARVVFDRQARLPLDSQLLRTLDTAPVLVVASPEADADRLVALRGAGAEVVVAGGIRPALAELGAREITSLFLEGGRTLAAAFADAGEIDEARVFVAPLLLAGAKRVPALDPGAEDTLIETRFREW